MPVRRAECLTQVGCKDSVEVKGVVAKRRQALQGLSTNAKAFYSSLYAQNATIVKVGIKVKNSIVLDIAR